MNEITIIVFLLLLITVVQAMAFNLIIKILLTYKIEWLPDLHVSWKSILFFFFGGPIAWVVYYIVVYRYEKINRKFHL